MVGGYMAYFSGGFGNIGFGDYSLIDFLFFLPTLTLTGLSIFYDNILRVLGNIFIDFIAPNFAGIIAAYWLYKISNFSNYLPALTITTVLPFISLISWLIGVTTLLSDTPKERWKPFLLQFLGSLLFGITAVVVATRGVPAPSIKIDPILSSAILFLGDLLILITGISGFLILILLVGITIAREAIRYEYLSKVIRIELTQAVPGLERWRVQASEKEHISFFSLFKSKPLAPTNYQYEPKGAVLLIASLKRVTALYVHQSDVAFKDAGRLFLISNSNISSIEVRSGKKS